MALGTPSAAFRVPTPASNPRPNTMSGGDDGGDVEAPPMAQSSWSPAYVANQALSATVPVATGQSVTSAPPPTGYTASPGMNTAIDYNRTAYAPQTAAYQSSVANGIGSLGVLGADYNTRVGFQQGDYDRAMRGVGIDRQALGISQQDLATRRARLGLDRQGLGVDRDYIAKMQGFARDALAQTLGGIGRNEKFDKRDTSSGYTSRGAWFAPFHSQDLQRITDTANQSRAEANIGYGRESAGYERDLARNALSDQGIDLSYRDLGSEEQRLSLTAQQLGLREEELYAMLQQGLHGLGIDYQNSVYDLLAGMAASGNGADLYLQMFVDALANSGDPRALEILGTIYGNAAGIGSATTPPVDAQGRPIPMGPM